jgi:hypothetical protein
MTRKEWVILSTDKKIFYFKKYRNKALCHWADTIIKMKQERPGVRIILHHTLFNDLHYEKWNPVIPMFIDEHSKYHTAFMTEEWRMKLSKATKNRTQMYYDRLGKCNKGLIRSSETKRKISEKKKGCKHTEAHKNKIGISLMGNTHTKNKKWFNNGIINIMSDKCPVGFIAGRIKWKRSV